MMEYLSLIYGEENRIVYLVVIVEEVMFICFFDIEVFFDLIIVVMDI